MSAVAAAELPRGTSGDVAYLAEIPVATVDIGANVRVDVGDLSELKASIEELGVLEPIVVTEQFGPKGAHGYRLVVGQRRLTACRELGRLTIPAIVRPAGDVDEPGLVRSIEQLAENLIRKELNPIEEAIALREVLDADPQLTQAELARRLGMSAPWVANTLGLLEAPATVQESIRTGELTASHAKALKGLAPKTQAELAKQAIDQGLSAHSTEQLVQAHKRDEEWRKSRQADAAQQRAAITTALVERLAKRGTDPATQIRVSSWNDDAKSSAAVDALRKAGYTDVHRGTGTGWQRDGCGCTAINVQISYGEPSISPVCIVKAHVEAANAKRDAKWKAEQKLERDAKAAIQERLRDELADVKASSVWPRVLLWQLIGWNMREWAKRHAPDVKKPDPWKVLAGLTDQAVRDELVTRLGDRFSTNDASSAMQSILDELRPAAAVVEAPKPARKPKPKPTDVITYTPAQLAAARAELDLDGAD
jgi:ParB family chromosome partitioning protein